VGKSCIYVWWNLPLDILICCLFKEFRCCVFKIRTPKRQGAFCFQLRIYKWIQMCFKGMGSSWCLLVCVMLVQVHFRSCCKYLLYGELLSVSQSIWARNWMNPEKTISQKRVISVPRSLISISESHYSTYSWTHSGWLWWGTDCNDRKNGNLPLFCSVPHLLSRWA
jgi:hypothetical protein